MRARRLLAAVTSSWRVASDTATVPDVKHARDILMTQFCARRLNADTVAVAVQFAAGEADRAIPLSTAAALCYATSTRRIAASAAGTR